MLKTTSGLFLAIFLLTGCGGGSGDNSSPSANVSISEFASALELNVTQEVFDNVNILNDNLVDYYKVDINQTGIYTLYVESISAGTNADYAYTLETQIYNSDETYMQTNSIYFSLLSNGQESTTTEFEIQDIGTYYFKIYRNRVGIPEDIATYYKFSIEKSISNGLVQDAEGELNDVLSQASPLVVGSFINDVNGTVNTTRHNDLNDWYELKNLDVGIYTLYLETKTGTVGSQGRSLGAKIYDIYGNVYSDLTTNYSIYDMDEENEWVRRTFEVNTEGSYFINISREYNMASAYSFKVLPSIANGYVLDVNGEPNDEQVLAKSITLTDTNTTITDSINMTATTDSDDWFEFTSDVTQTINVKLETLTATQTGTYTLKLEILNSNGVVIKSIPNNQFLLDQADEETTDSVSLVNGSKYYLHINRRYNIPTDYKITMSKN